MRAHQIIKRPLLSEKGSRLKLIGNGEQQREAVLFEVHSDANKIEVWKAIEELFPVKVADVRTINVRGKAKRVGRFAGRRADWKKAIVTLEPGNKIEFFEGV